MAAPPSKERELSLVEKVEFRFALADNDDKLQILLGTYLPPLLLKLRSEHVQVRQKVISVCQHIKARIKPENIKLPVAALINQFQENADSRLIRHFDLLYLQDGFARLPPSDRAKLLPTFTSGMHALSSAPPSEASVVFHLFLQALIHFQYPPKDSPEDALLRETLGLSDEDASYLSHWIERFLLYRSNVTNSSSAGLSIEERDFLKSEAWNASSLANAKYSCLKLVGSGAFRHDERLWSALLASADSNTRISELAEEILKRCLPDVDMSDKHVLGKLFNLYLRRDTSNGTSLASSTALRIRILSVLAKTPSSTTFTSEIRDIVAHDLVGQDNETGRESTKLRSAVVQLLLLVARQASKHDLLLISQDVVGTLKDFLDQQYADRASLESTDLRCRSFEVVGLLASASSDMLVEPSLALLRWLFRGLSEERDKEVALSIFEALSHCIRPFQSIHQQDIVESLRDLLIENLSSESSHALGTLYSTLRFTNRCLPVDDVSARWINLSVLASKLDKTHEITEEAQKGLDPYWLKLSRDEAEKVSLPDFPKIAAFIFDRQKDALQDPDTATVVIKFCRQCLIAWCVTQEGHNIEFTIDWQSKLDVAVQQDLAFRRKIFHALEKQRENLCWQLIMEIYHLACQNLAIASKDRSVHAGLITELASVCPSGLVGRMAGSFAALENALYANDIEVRLQAAQAYGLLASHPVNTDDVLTAALDRLDVLMQGWHVAVGADMNRSHGAILATAHFAGLRSYRGLAGKDASNRALRVLSVAVTILKTASDITIRDAAFRTLSVLGMFSAISFTDLEKQEPFDALVEQILRAAKDGREPAILAHGHLGLLLSESHEEEKLTKFLENLRQLHEIRQPETQFAVGEALSVIGLGWQSSAMEPYLIVDSPKPMSLPRTSMLKTVVERVLEDCKNTKPALKKASVIWLLCMIQFCGHSDEIQDRLRAFQAAFKRCLSDRDELVQESASRGLGLVYEKGNRGIKDDLVRDLVSSFSSNKADISGTVSEDTQLFEPGALPTGEGSVSTYKDIMSLASEVGDPSLVYRFMSLASNNAIWSNRAAFGRFGLSNVLSDSSVDGYLANNPKMYPALYRYRFDPNTNVRRSMNEIWTALVKDPVKTVSDHFDLIITDLLKHMTGREWRARQASCAAVADLMQGRRLAFVQPYLDQAWSQCFKVLDDIKETVRKEAGGLARILTNILINNLESIEGKADTIRDLLKSVIPFLLSTSGVESGADDVKLFSLQTLLEIIKKAKPAALRPFLPHLISQLLTLLTSFEPDAVNYVGLNASQYNLKQSDIDDARLQVIRSSPIMEAVERALDMLDEQTIGEVIPKILETMRVAVGVPTKVGCSRTLVSLSTRKNFIFRPYVDQTLTALGRRVMDRNETVSSSYAASFGYLARIASDDQVLRTVTSARELYFGEADDDRPRFIAAEIMHALAKSATDRFHALSSSLMPFVFFGRFDDTERVRQVFKETYDEVASGPRVISLYLQEILTLSQEHLTSARWTLKHASAKVLAEAIRGLDASHGTISAPQADSLWRPMQEALAQKTWDGKSHLLTGFVVFVEKVDPSWRLPKEEVLKKIALREARRRNKDYQGPALESLGKVAEALSEVDMLDDVKEVAEAVLRDTSEAMDVDDEDSKGAGSTGALLVANAVEAVYRASRLGRIEGAQALLARSTLSLDCAQHAYNLPPAIAHSNPLSIAVFTNIRRLCEALPRHQPPEQLALSSTGAPPQGSPSFLDRVLTLLTTSTHSLQEKPRTLRAEAFAALAALTAPLSAPDFTQSLRSTLETLIAEEKSLPIRNVLLSAQRYLTVSPSS